MTKYYRSVNGKPVEITEQEAKEQERKNQELFNSGDFSKMLEIENILKTENKEDGTINNQEIFEILAENECKLFYAWASDRENKELKEAHEAAKKALEAFAKATGCHN